MAGIDFYTKLLLHFDGDLSSSNHTIRHFGAPEYRSDVNAFGGSSLWFDGGNDHLTLADHDDWNFGTSDFTIEFRIMFDGIGSHQTIFMMWDDWDNFVQMYFDISNGLYFYAENANNRFVEFNQGSTSGWSTGTWYHVALVRNGTTFTVYRDGTPIASQSSVSASMPNLSSDLFIGRNASYAQNYFGGSLNELRISDTARWTTDFTPDTDVYESDANTLLLVHMNGDSSDGGHKVITYNTRLNSTIKKFNSSMYFDGVGDYIGVADSDDWDFGNESFTMDWWEYRTDSSFLKCTVSRGYSGTQTAFSAGIANPGGTDLEFFASSNGSSWDIANAKDMGSLDLNTWVHHAIVRDNNTWYIFKDGTQTDTWSHSGTLLAASVPLAIGVYNGGNWFAGYLDEFRISKGVARWTEDFTPPGTRYSRGIPEMVDVIGVKGSYSDTTRIIVINESDWSVEYNSTHSGSGYYEIQPLVSGTKTLVGIRESDGSSIGYGNVLTDTWQV